MVIYNASNVEVAMKEGTNVYKGIFYLSVYRYTSSWIHTSTFICIYVGMCIYVNAFIKTQITYLYICKSIGMK